MLRARLERLACGFPLRDNYFAWQAFNRGYAPGGSGPLPLYLQQELYGRVREAASRVEVRRISMTQALAAMPSQSVDRVVLLDAQDWMRTDQLDALWSEITRPPGRAPASSTGRPAWLHSSWPRHQPCSSAGDRKARSRSSPRWIARRSMAASTSIVSRIVRRARASALGGGGDRRLMDSIYRRQRHIYDFSRNIAFSGATDLIAELNPPNGSRVLEIAAAPGAI